MTPSEASSNSFVLLQLGSRRFALPAGLIAELAPPLPLHSFPHTSALLSGVIVRRSRIVAVYDASQILTGKRSSLHRFYLIARREFGKVSELSAIPVDGECELVSSEVRPPASGDPAYVTGRITVAEEDIAVLNFESLIRQEPAMEEPAHRAVPS